MTQTELDILVAQIGEEILARVGGGVPAPAKKGEGLNLPAEVCPGCVQRCVQTCAKNTRTILAAGADYVVSGDKALLNLKSHHGVEIVRPSRFLKVLFG